MKKTPMTPSEIGRSVLVGIAAASVVCVPFSSFAFRFDANKCAPTTKHVPRGPNVMMYVDQSASMQEPSGQGGAGALTVTDDVTTQGTFDESLMVSSASDPENPTGKKGLTLSKSVKLPPYAWVANHDYDTVSKFNMNTLREEGRYWVGDNPSRTAVDLDGNVWVGTRSSTHLTKILWDSDLCDRNFDGTNHTSYVNSSGNVVQVNGASNAMADECLLYHAKPTTAYGGIRGLAAGPNGKMWIGYTSGNGALQSIDTKTFALSQPYSGSNKQMLAFAPVHAGGNEHNLVPVGVQNTTVCGSYGLVIDSKGLAYHSNTCRDRLPVFDTNSKQWVAVYYTHNTAMYGITIDADDRVWVGGYPSLAGVRMFDLPNMKYYSYATNKGSVTGLAVEPATGDVWASFYVTGYTGRLRFNPSNPRANNWALLNTTANRGNDLRGVGFDTYGNVWTMGLGSDRIYKIDPATTQLSSDMPNGKSVGQGGHYTYSDFTGSVALSFTAPTGKWNKIYDLGGARVDKIKLEGYVPNGTGIGLRYRALNADGSPASGWIPAEDNGAPDYQLYQTDSSSTTFNVPHGNDNPFTPQKLEVEVRLGTSDKGIRPFLYNVELIGDATLPSWDLAGNISKSLANASVIPGDCDEDDGRTCDYLRTGLTLFNSTTTVVSETGEDTSGDINTNLNNADPSGLTGISKVAEKIATTPSLQDPKTDNVALIVTDARANRADEILTAVGHLCSARDRGVSPVTTYAVLSSGNGDENLAGLYAAAGGTGHCCAGSSTSCAPAAQIDPCTYGALGSALSQTGTAPYTEATLKNNLMSCAGARLPSDVTQLKLDLLAQADDAACILELDIPDDPDMYNEPSYPQLGALMTSGATKVIMDHANWRLLELPYCEPGHMDCGLEATMRAKGSISDSTASDFADEGWYFANPERSKVRLTDKLCEEVQERRTLNVTTQLACQCSLDGQACHTGKPGRCAAGTYICDEVNQADVCTSDMEPMPETCNGLDDDCDGSVDNLDQAREYWEDLRSMDPNADAFYEEGTILACNFADSCSCDNIVREHLGDDLGEYLNAASGQSCICRSALSPTDDVADPTTPTATHPTASGCSATHSDTHPTAPGALLALFGLLLVRVRRRR